MSKCTNLVQLGRTRERERVPIINTIMLYVVTRKEKVKLEPTIGIIADWIVRNLHLKYKYIDAFELFREGNVDEREK